MLLDTLRERRSIRRFTNQPVEQDKIDQLVEAMLRSPSSKSQYPWSFVVVQDKEKLEKLSGLKPHGATFLKNAPLAIVVCGDPELCDVWVEDCSIASIILHIQAADLGLGSCWIQVRKREHESGIMGEQYVQEELNLPPSLNVLAVIAIGYPEEEKKGHPKDSLLYERVHQEIYKEK